MVKKEPTICLIVAIDGKDVYLRHLSFSVGKKTKKGLVFKWAPSENLNICGYACFDKHGQIVFKEKFDSLRKKSAIEVVMPLSFLRLL